MSFLGKAYLSSATHTSGDKKLECFQAFVYKYSRHETVSLINSWHRFNVHLIRGLFLFPWCLKGFHRLRGVWLRYRLNNWEHWEFGDQIKFIEREGQERERERERERGEEKGALQSTLRATGLKNWEAKRKKNFYFFSLFVFFQVWLLPVYCYLSLTQNFFHYNRFLILAPSFSLSLSLSLTLSWLSSLLLNWVFFCTKSWTNPNLSSLSVNKWNRKRVFGHSNRAPSDVNTTLDGSTHARLK